MNHTDIPDRPLDPPEPEPEERDPDEAYDAERQQEIDDLGTCTDRYELHEIAAEMRRDELNETLEDIGGVFSPGFMGKSQA